MRNRVGGGRSGKAILLLALFLGLVSAVLVYVYLSQAGDEETAASDTTKSVVVATEDINVATRITDSMVRLKEISADAVHPDAFTSTEGVVGNLARYPITAGEQILSDRVAASSASVPEGEDLPLPYIVPDGKRAVSVIMSDLIGAGGLLRPGDYVDVILTVKLASQDQIGRIILQDVELLALDQQVEKVAPKFEEGEEGEEERISTGEGETDPEAVTVTLAVAPVEGEVLAVADKCADNFQGRLALALRPFGDHSTVDVRPTWSETGETPLCSQLFGVDLSSLKGSDEEVPAPSQPPTGP
ncbi:MAG: Flp pilus assembly protein CpaB [Dehalococcoidia bacterium]|nr:MAG: Flp pilus assembly protein CpaB [Dehalococcoidia bacterium]